jgi:uncharacterized HAD superfamily protein
VIRFVSLSQLVNWTDKWIQSFPQRYDLIVGIPRSGLLVANIIAQKMARPLTTPELFLKGHYWLSKSIKNEKPIESILLVDDSVSSGRTMSAYAESLLQQRPSISLTRAALIVTKKSEKLVDFYYKIVSKPHVFEWNLMHYKRKKRKVACDMDGVLCENCPPGIDKNEELYVQWLTKARPYLIPAFTIDAIVTNRLEKYRRETETWLLKHEVRYKELIMWDIPSKRERKGRYAENKIEVLSKIKPSVFWESNYRQAMQIWEATRIPTICIDKMILVSTD